MLPLLTIRRFDCDGVTVLSLAGEIDMSNASRLEAAVELNTDARLVIDLRSAATGVYAPLADMLAAPFRATVIRPLT